MATVKLRFCPSKALDREGVLYYRIAHNNNVRQFKTGYHIFASEWNEVTSSIRITGNEERKRKLSLIRDCVSWEFHRIYLLINDWEMRHTVYTVGRLSERIRQLKPCRTVFTFMLSVIEKKKVCGHLKTGENYRTAFTRFRAFRQNVDLCFDAFDSDLMRMFESWLRGSGLKRNTTSAYLRCLRSVYSMAVDEGLVTDDRKPAYVFRQVYTGIDKTVKRALSRNGLRKIKDLDLSDHTSLEFARDIFMFSFYTRGMSFVDIAYLRKSDVRYGTLTYCRRKTGQRLSMRWEKEMQEIAGRYPNRHTRYLFPVIRREDGTEPRQYRNALRLVNRKLKSIARLAGLDTPLTLYVARHSWASLAKASRIPVSVISEGMGHDSEKTTQIYLESLESSVVDKANRMIISRLQ